MEITKVFLQAVIVISWGVYVFFHVWSDLRGISREDPGPTAWVDLFGSYLHAISIEPLVLSTVVLVAGLIGLEVVFAIIYRLRET